jgi:hypothetical protein
MSISDKYNVKYVKILRWDSHHRKTNEKQIIMEINKFLVFGFFVVALST